MNNLHMIFAGQILPNPSELLGSNEFVSMIKELSGSYDYIFIDTPPIGSVIDAAVVSRICDGSIMVIASKTISYKFAQKMKNQLERSGTKLIGAVLNKVDMSSTGYYGKYYGKYYK